MIHKIIALNFILDSLNDPEAGKVGFSISFYR